jgi:uncharacterized membrane protein YdbT with pleckstrin-like domain
MEQIDPDEVKLADTRKHPMGIILLYVQVLIGMIFAVGLAYFLLPLVLEDTDTAFFIGNIFTAISVVMAFIVLTIATIIFRENRIIVTDRNITQVLQYGLFSRKVSQLNINNVEDVTALQQGILPTIFNYGTLKIETAGEQINFHFSFCPNADYYAKIILDAREQVLGQTSSQATEKKMEVVQEKKDKEGMSSEAIKDIGAETIKQASTNKY